MQILPLSIPSAIIGNRFAVVSGAKHPMETSLEPRATSDRPTGAAAGSRAAHALLHALVFSTVTIFSAIAQVLSGHVPQIIKDLNLQPVERLAATNVLHLAIGLPLRDPKAAKALIQQLYDPASPFYHQYLTPEQFTERFGPTEQDYEAVIAFAKANGFRIAGTHPNRLLLDVEAPAADIETAF